MWYSRSNWKSYQWTEYYHEDSDFSNRFRKALLDGNIYKVKELVEEGEGYYHFPHINDLIEKELISSSTLKYLEDIKDLFYEDRDTK